MFPFAKLFIEIIDNSQTKRVRDLKILPDLEQGLKIKMYIFAKRKNWYLLQQFDINYTNLLYAFA